MWGRVEGGGEVCCDVMEVRESVGGGVEKCDGVWREMKKMWGSVWEDVSG